MRRFVFTILLVGLVRIAAAQSSGAPAAVDKRVDSILSRMTLEEKITYIGGPSGKLPASFERQWEDNATFHSYYPKPGEKQVEYSEGVFLGYRHFDRAGVKPLFPFGYGLSYTTFAYHNLKVSPDTGNLNEPVIVSFDLENTGHYEGAEVAQVYVSDNHVRVPRPVKELKGFARTELKPGESRHVSVALDRRAFSYYDVLKKNWNADPGSFGILVGSSSDKIELQGTFVLAP
ncbi:MAG: fibronectin type III-like domain-contianing protein [Terriglobales bacterium]